MTGMAEAFSRVTIDSLFTVSPTTGFGRGLF